MTSQTRPEVSGVSACLQHLAACSRNAVLALDGSLRGLFCNAPWTRATGLDLFASRGLGWQAALDPQDVLKLAAIAEMGDPAGEPFSVRLRGAHGVVRDGLVTLIPADASFGAACRWMLMAEVHDTDESAGPLGEEGFRVCIESLLDCFGVFSAIRDAQGAIVDFRVDYLNANACRNNGRALEDQVGRGLLELMPGHRETGLFEAYCEVVARGTTFERTLAFPEHDDPGWRSRWFEIRAVCLGDGFVAAWRDVTERRREHEASRRHELLFARLAQAHLLGVGVATPQGQLRFANAELLRMLGRSEASLAAGELDWLAALSPAAAPAAREALGTSTDTGSVTGSEWVFVRPDGSQVPFLGAAALLTETEVVLFAVDLSATKAAQTALARSESQLRLALEAADAGIWTVDLSTGEATWTEENRRLYGIGPEVVPTFEAWSRLVHPEDLPRVLAVRAAAIQDPDAQYRVEYRVRDEHGAVRWLLALGRVERDHGQAVSMMGVNIDVTETKRVAGQLAESEERFRTMADGLPLIIWVHDAHGRQQFVNRTFCEYFGVTLEDVRDGRWSLLTHPEDRAAYVDAFLKAV